MNWANLFWILSAGVAIGAGVVWLIRRSARDKFWDRAKVDDEDYCGTDSMTCPYCQILQPCGCPNDWSQDDDWTIDLTAPVQLTEGAKAWLAEPGVIDYLNAEWAKLGLKPLK